MAAGAFGEVGERAIVGGLRREVGDGGILIVRRGEVGCSACFEVSECGAGFRGSGVERRGLFGSKSVKDGLDRW